MRSPIFLCLAVLSAALTVALATPTDDARKSGESWLALVDSQKYSDSWTVSSPYFQSQVPQQRWMELAQKSRKPLGLLMSRKFMNVTFKKSGPGVPDGQYAVLSYQTTFKNKAKAVETITLILDHGKWKTAGYFVR